MRVYANAGNWFVDDIFVLDYILLSARECVRACVREYVREYVRCV